MDKKCFQCGDEGKELYGYSVCESCATKLGLLSDETIGRHVSLYKATKKHSYAEEIDKRLDYIEKDYIKKKIKLMHVKDRLKQIG